MSDAPDGTTGQAQGGVAGRRDASLSAQQELERMRPLLTAGCSLRAAPPKTEVGEGAHGRGPISDRELADMVNAINTARNAGKSVLTIRTQDAATLFEKLAAAEAKNAELERHARIALDCGQNVDAQNERLRGKCSRQRKELRRLNEKHFEDRGATLIAEARAKEARADCLKMSGIAAKAYEDTNKLRAELSALREQNESLERKLAGAQHCTDEQAEEIDTLRAKEADVARKQR